MSLLSIESVTKRFGGLVANDRVSFDVEKGEIVGLIGPNGAGKSTLFNCAAGYFRPDDGRIYFRGKDVTGLPPEKIAKRKLGRTFQIVKVFLKMTVLENVMVGAFIGSANVGRASDNARKWIDYVGLSEKMENLASELTLAEQKWLQLARTLAIEPEMLLMDEVLAGLTASETKNAVELIRKVRDEKGITILIVEHVMDVIMPLSDRVIVLDNGRKISEGSPGYVSKDPVVIKAYLGEE